MSDWTLLPGFPRTLPAECAPWGSSVRFVNGARDVKNGKSVTLSGAKAFLQRLEIDLIAGRAAAPDLPTLVDTVLTSHARHIDVVEWCRVRGDELDLQLRVYGTRGSQRLHLNVLGPIGRHADDPLPVHAKIPAKPATKKPAVAVVAPAAPPTETLPPPAQPLLLRPITPGAGPSYGDPVAHDLDGRVHLVVRLPDGDAWARVDPSGAADITPMTRRDVLREADPGARTGAMLASLHASAAGLVRVDHYENSSGMQERVHHAGRCTTGRSFLSDGDWTLGVAHDWFLRVIVHNKKATLLGVDLAAGKRTRLALPHGDDLRGAALDHTPDGDILRLLGRSEERRLRLHIQKSPTVDPSAIVPLPFEGAVQSLPNDGWLVASGRTLRRVRPDRSAHDLFTLPASFTAPDYAPWGPPKVAQIHFPDPVWLAHLDFGSDHGPRCTGVLVFTAAGQVRGLALRDADDTLRINAAAVPLAEGEHPCGWTAGPTGDLAVALTLKAGLSLAWAPPA